MDWKRACLKLTEGIEALIRSDLVLFESNEVRINHETHCLIVGGNHELVEVVDLVQWKHKSPLRLPEPLSKIVDFGTKVL